MAEDDSDAVFSGEAATTEFATYEDYLDSQITKTDLYYLEDQELARQLVELGYRGSGEARPLRLLPPPAALAAALTAALTAARRC